MSLRATLGLLLLVGALGIGLWTAWIAAANHGAGRELDRRMRACDALEIWNESLLHEVLEAEEALLEGQIDAVSAEAEG